MDENTVVVKVTCTDDHNELTKRRKESAVNMALKCLQKMCAEDQGIFIITPSGWRFSFNSQEKVL